MTFRDKSADTTLDGANMNIEECTPNQRRALSKGLAALEAMAGLWASEIRLSEIALKLASAPGDTRANGIAGMIEQAFIEGAYRHFLDRQPEIDALKDSLHRAINDARNFCQIGLNNWSEIQRLKAENERLRADAERYAWLRNRDLDTIGQGGIFAGLTPDNVVVNGDDLDRRVDVAMKDFSTTTKEDGAG